MYRILSLCLIALALVVFAGAPALAQDKNAGNSHEGTIVSATATQIVMKDKAGKEMTHQLATGAEVLCDGKTCKLADLKPGQKVRITTKKGDEKTATKVEALDKNKTFGSGGTSK
jgi:hypothetical protein